jgi:hypothetical protein
MMYVRKLQALVVILCCCTAPAFSQSFQKADVVIGFNYGVPHLYKGIVKAATGSEQFKAAFAGTLEVSGVTGINPVSAKGEFGIEDWLGVGFSASMWTINIDVIDRYNVQNGQLGLKDESDTYKFKITSKSFGIRPNIRFPFKSRSNDLYFGMGIGITKNKLAINFTSTDINKVFPDLEYEIGLPGGVYFAPSLGYRHYFGEYVGMNFEFGYEKGAILQGGIVVRFNVGK